MTETEMTASQHDDPADRLANLASARLGARVLSVTDDFFAEADRMLADSEPVFIADKFDDHGKWMDGWESRRRRGPGHDSAVLELGAPGEITWLEIDTRHFTGNYPMAASVEACWRPTGTAPQPADWQPLLPVTALQGDRRHLLPVAATDCSHLRLHIYPDGGLARFKAYGTPRVDWNTLDNDGEMELSAARLGGRVLACSDAHFGRPDALLYPGRGRNMGDGWETRRRREPGFDWCLIALGHAGRVTRLEVDTAFFKGNYPAEVSVQAATLPADTGVDQVRAASLFWDTLLEPQPLGPDAIHEFAAELAEHGPITHVRLNMHPDGGISRFRVFGRAAFGRAAFGRAAFGRAAFGRAAN